MKMAAATVVNAVNDVDKNKYQYSKVNLSLENCILPPDKLSLSPSQIDGLDHESEIELRILGCELIQTSGRLLRLPQVAMATGQVLFQRFYYSKSFVRHSMEVVAMACITLASKIEEAPRRIRDVVNVFHHIKQVKFGKTIQPLILDQNYINLKNQVIKAERRVLKELGFCVHVKHPHKIIVTLLEVLKVKNQKLMQTAWNYMNDSLRTEVFVRYDPETIACACIYLGARILKIPLPDKPAWFLVFNVTEADITDICHVILSLYSRWKPDPDKLEKVVDELRKAHQEAKLKAKGLLAAGHLLALPSPASNPGSPQNGKSSPAEAKKEKNDGKHNDSSPKTNKETNHRKRLSPESPENNKKSSSGSATSPSPKRKQKTPPRGFKESHRPKKAKHRSSHKRRRSPSPKRRSRSREHNSLHHKSRKTNHHSRDKKRR